MRVTIEMVWSLGGRRKTAETYVADNAEELNRLQQYFITELEKIKKIPTAKQTVYFEAEDGTHPYGWDDALNCVNNRPFCYY